MTGFLIDIQTDVDGPQRIFAQLEAKVQQSSLADWLYNVVSPYVAERIQDRFSSEGDDVSGPWAPLRSTTEAFRTSKGFPPDHPINVRTHLMEGFLVGDPGRVSTSGAGVTLTHPGNTPGPLTALKIQAAQQGKTFPQTPPRPVIGLSNLDSIFINSELVRYLFSGLT
jgi:hypothetical protein